MVLQLRAVPCWCNFPAAPTAHQAAPLPSALPAGGLVGELLKKQGAKFEYGTARLEDRAAILADIERVGAWP